MNQVGLFRNGGGSLSSDSTSLRSEKDPSWSVLYIFLFLLECGFAHTCFAFALCSPARFDLGICMYRTKRDGLVWIHHLLSGWIRTVH